MLDAKQKRVALVRVVRSADQITPAVWQETIALARYVETYTRHVNQSWDFFEVTPFVIWDATQNFSLSFNFKARSVTDQLAELDEDYARHNYWAGIGGAQGGLQGIAWTGSYKSWNYMTGGGRTIVHELWHCFGLEHSWADQDAYGGRDFQGKHASTHNAAALIYLGQIGQDEIADIDQGAAILIPVECKRTDARPGEYRAVRVIRDGRIAILSVHKADHQVRHGKGVALDGALWVHTWDPDTRPTYRTMMLGQWMAPATLPNGARVSITAEQDGAYRVNVDSSDAARFPGWPNVDPDLPIDETCNSIWHDPRYKYQGIDLHVRNGQVVGYWFTHLPKGGRVWLMLDGEFERGAAEFDVYRTDGRSPKLDGSARLVRTGPDSAFFQVRCKTFGIDHLKLERLSPVRDSGEFSGLFKTGNLEGFSSSVFSGHYMVAYHYYYDGGKPVWSMYDGLHDDLDIYLPETIHRGYYGDLNHVGQAKAANGKIDGYTLERLM